MATFSRAQTAEADGLDPTATFASTPTDGNLLVAIAFSRSGTASANHTISGSGWTKRIARDTELANASFRRSLSVWSKVAGAAEPTGIQVTGDTVRLVTQEFSTDVSVTWTFEQKADNDNGTTNDATSIATGTTASVGAGDLLLVGVLGERVGAILATIGVSWASENLTNNFSSGEEDTNDGGRHIATAWLQQTTGGTKASTATLSGGTQNTGLSAGIVVFSAAAAGATGQPYRKRTGGIPFMTHNRGVW